MNLTQATTPVLHGCWYPGRPVELASLGGCDRARLEAARLEAARLEAARLEAERAGEA